jgi:hypothetical protein
VRHKPLQIFSTLLLLVVSVAYASAQGTPTVTYPSSSAVSPHLSDLPSGNSRGPLPLKKFARPPLKRHGGNKESDRALQTAAGRHLDVDTQPNFAGIGENGYIPGDPNIAVGPNHVVQVVNSEIAVFDKSGNVFAGYPKSLGSLWSSLGGPCTNNNGDPIAQYDRVADRFIITQLGSLSSPYSECIAVSTTNDPTGSYHLYSYDFGSNLNDYDKFGVWPTASNSAYLATYNLFANGGPFVGADLCAYDRNAMLSGAASPAQICFTISQDGGFLPADVDGPNAPLDGTPGLFLNFETQSSLRMYKLSPNFATPASSTLSASPDIGVLPFNEACGGGTCIPQPGTAQTLDSLGDRLMYRLAYRRFSDHEAMVVNHSVVAGSSVGVRWYELRNIPASTSAAFNLFQQGTYAPDSSYRWMGSIAMDQAGDIGLGYSTSSASVYPSVNYTGRKPADAAGTMEAEGTIQAGGGSQTGFSRWGDYSAMRIDPSDDCTFWYTNEYYPVTSSGVWYTAIGSFKLSNCTGTPDFSISSAATPLTFTAGVGGSTTSGSVTVQSLNGFNSPVGLAVAGACGTNSITCTLGTGSLTPSGGSANTSLTIGIGTGTPANSYSITVNGTNGALKHSTTLTVVVSAPPPPPSPDFNISASPSSLTVSRGSTGSSVVSLGKVGGSSSVSLSVSGLPSRTTASFNANPVTTTGTTTVTISVNRIASTGTRRLTITGKNGSFTHSTRVTLTIH